MTRRIGLNPSKTNVAGAELSDRELRAEILAGLDARALELIGERRDRGTEVLGVARVLAQRRFGIFGEGAKPARGAALGCATDC